MKELWEAKEGRARVLGVVEDEAKLASDKRCVPFWKKNPRLKTLASVWGVNTSFRGDTFVCCGPFTRQPLHLMGPSSIRSTTY